MNNEHRTYSEKYWFKQKRYGFGWAPAGWQGWVLTALYLCFMIGLPVLSSVWPTRIPLADVPLPLIAVTLLYLVVCWKTGEPLKWRRKERSDK